MRNNKTTATEPLRTGETVDILTQQILGVITRTGHGPFESVEVKEPTTKTLKARKTKSKK